MIDRELDHGDELEGRALELQSLEDAGVVDPEYASKRLVMIMVAMSLHVAARRRRWLELVRDQWAFKSDEDPGR